MILTYRCRQILKKIIDAKRPLRIKELADEFRVSVRAVKYDLETIRLWMRKQNNTCIRLEAKPNRGIWLEGDETLITQLAGMINQEKEQTVVLSQDERVKYIILELLAADDYITISSLEDKIGVSRNTVVSDLQEVEQFLKNWNCQLKRIVYRGMKVNAAEMDRRLVLEYIVQSFLNSKDMSSLLQSLLRDNEVPPRIKQVIAQFLLAYQDIEYIYQAVRHIVRQARESEDNYLSERAVLGLFIRFCVVVQRIRTNHLLSCSIVSDLTAGRHSYYLQIKEECAVLAGCLGISFPESEINYIWLQWHSVFGHAAPGISIQGQPLDIIAITGELIAGVSRLAKVPFHEDTELFDSLLTHLTDRLAKYQCGVLDPNPLVTEVMRTYGEMFRYVKEVCLEVLKGANILLNDADTAYLVLHFQAAFERRFGRYKYKTLVVCGTGRGSARLLKTRLENEIKSLHVIGCCSALEVDRVLQSYPIDLVISVLPLDISYPTVVVNAIPTKQDFETIYQVLKNIHTGNMVDLSDTFTRKDNLLTSLIALKAGLNTRELPLIESLSQEIINQGFQIATLITTEFKQYLTEQAAAGLIIHILLMVNRLVFGSSYVDFGFNRQAENERTALLREQLTKLLHEHYPGIPSDEVSIILRYFS